MKRDPQKELASRYRRALVRIENELARAFGEKNIALNAKKGSGELSLHLAGIVREALKR